VDNKRCKFGARLNVKGWAHCKREVVLVILTIIEN